MIKCIVRLKHYGDKLFLYVLNAMNQQKFPKLHFCFFPPLVSFDTFAILKIIIIFPTTFTGTSHIASFPEVWVHLPFPGATWNS